MLPSRSTQPARKLRSLSSTPLTSLGWGPVLQGMNAPAWLACPRRGRAHSCSKRACTGSKVPRCTAIPAGALIHSFILSSNMSLVPALCYVLGSLLGIQS